MRQRNFLFLVAIVLCFCVGMRTQVKAIWTTPLAPFRIADNLYYVGSQDLAAYLVTTPKGNILINANLPSSPAQIKTSVEQLGFRWKDTKILLVGQAHMDHAGGAAQIERETGAQLKVMEYDAEVMQAGGGNDFLMGTGSVQPYSPARVDAVLHDGDTVSLGGVVLTAHRTGGHTRGCTTWTMRVHLPGEPAGKLRDVVIVGGYTQWSDYRLVPSHGRAASYPGIAEDFQHTFDTLRKLPCEVFLADHGEHFGIDPDGYRAVIDAGEASFQKALAEQQKAAASATR